MESQVERILILCKTYPSPSARYVETSCVAGISEAGELKRLYPVPFRLIQDEEAKQLRLLKKIPHDFYYRYEAAASGGVSEHRHKLVDWEVGALYWNCQRLYGRDWEAAFRQKLESEFAEKDLFLLMGNMHRFQNQWLAVSLIYPPRQRPETERQQSLFPE